MSSNRGSAKGRRGSKKDSAEESGDGTGKRLSDYHDIGNKNKRQEMYHKLKAAKREQKKKRKREEAQLGEDVPKKIQKTLDNTREKDETMVAPDDEEVKGDEAQDEFSKYFSGEAQPKIVITTGYTPSKQMYQFIYDLLRVFPNSFYYSRRNFELKKIIEYSKERGYTDLIVINEDKKKINGWTHVHLPDGPTAHYKLSSITMSADIPGHGRPSSHRPEVILNNFSTRLGHRVGRMLGALFHQTPGFIGRRVATFHNQRDFIFFRHHRYVFNVDDKGNKIARIQELGPRFTLKLRWLQHGTFDTKHGQFEWVHRTEMDTSRRRFFL